MKKMLIAILLMISPLTMVKANTVDFSKKGVVTIELVVDQTKVRDAEISISLIARASEKDNNLDFVYLEDLGSCSVDSTFDLTSDQLSCIEKLELTSLTKVTDEDGKVEFDNLDLGLYLVKQTNRVEGYSVFEPFLVMLPQVVDNVWSYEINSQPKIDIVKLVDLTVKKVWNNSKKTVLPESVMVELYRDDEVIDTVILNDLNDWMYVWKDMEKSDGYFVKEVNIPLGYVASYKEDNYTFTVTNTDSLIKTGQSNLIILCLALFGIVSILIGVRLEKGLRNV